IVKRSTRFEKIMDVIERKKRQRDIVQAVVAFEEHPQVWLRDPERVNAVARTVQRHLEAIASDLLPVSAVVEEDPEHNSQRLVFVTRANGGTHRTVIDMELCLSPEFEELRRLAGELAAAGSPPFTLTMGDRVVQASTLREAVEHIVRDGRKGLE